jgi:hypothetical protein
MVGRIPKWLLGFEQRINAKLAAIDGVIRADHDEQFRRANILLNDSKEAREDNLTTLPRLREYLERIEAMQREHTGTLAAHCQRLMREKITLQNQLESANRYMAFPGPREAMSSTYANWSKDWVSIVRPRAAWTGAKGDVGHSAPVWCDQHLCWCTDSETPLHKFFAIGPRPEVTVCSFASTHRPGIVCRVCGWFEHKQEVAP